MSSPSSLINTLTVVQRNITLYIYPIWLIFGIIGCLLNLIVFSRPQLRTTSCCIYLLAASIDHLITLVIGIGPALYSLIKPDPQIQILIFCKIRNYLFQICLMVPRWFIVFACIDRYALTSVKIRLRNFAKTNIAYRIILIIIIFWPIICSHRLIFYEIKGNICGIVNNMGAAIYHSIYVIIGGGVCPVIIMIICSLLIRRNLARRQKRRSQLSVNTLQTNSLDHQVLIIFYIQIISYIIFIIPQLCNLVFNTVSITISNKSDDYLAIQQFVMFIAEFMLYLFPVTSFYLYTLTSGTFRKELIKFIYSIVACCKENRRKSTIVDDTSGDYRLKNRHRTLFVIGE